ncbi:MULTISPECIES: hypothetical protein [Sorangium]|uniref:Dihydrolipoamide acetyltransferase n=1 Tax=Sorangium cellulosum TaxID=56 RepID=A0A4V0NH39_SORCE|nr:MULTISPECIES: hypothetical protein [Sorangium]AUX35332.1 hypothetical protein SOCE836_075230 [Sorangium cellulosum]WCQ94636.1 hypothetical protein NQZ70_07404 [Sorangium sp. Soce836]
MRLIRMLAVGVGASFLMAVPAFAQSPGAASGKAAAPAASVAPAASAPANAAQAAPATGAAAASPGTTAAPAAGAAASPGTTAAPAAGAAASPGTTAAPAPAASPGATAAPAAGAAAPAMDGPTYAVRLRDLEQRIDELKEQIRRSHTRLSLLSDTILSGGGAGSRASIRFNNELSSAFRVTRVLIVLDGAVQYNKTDQSGALAEQTEIPIFNGSVPPGDHTLQVLVNLQGNGYGVFSYLRGYRFEVRSSHSFTAVEGKTINLQAVAFEKGGVTTPLEERPAVRFVEKIVSGLSDASGQPAAAAGGK